VPLDCGVTVPTVSPAPVIALVAAVCVNPTTFGTGTCAGPVDTTRFTAVPRLSSVPANGLSLITFPAATVPLDCGVTVPTVSPAPVIALVAATCVNPTTFGTATCRLVTANPLASDAISAPVWTLTSRNPNAAV
jgi:hypothetical protein